MVDLAAAVLARRGGRAHAWRGRRPWRRGRRRPRGRRSARRPASVLAFSRARSLAPGMYSTERRGRRSVAHASLLLRTRRPRRARDRASASCWASSTITWHCLTMASSSILPSSMIAPVPSPIASMTRWAWATSAGSGQNTRLAMSIWLGVQAPGADAAEQVGVAELVLAGDGVLDVAERAVVREDAVGHAGVDHAGDRVVPQVLLVGGPRARRGRPGRGPGAPGSRGGRRRRGWSSSGGWRRGRPGRATGPACAGWRAQISSTLATPRAVSRMACTRSGRSSPALASSWASSRST